MRCKISSRFCTDADSIELDSPNAFATKSAFRAEAFAMTCSALIFIVSLRRNDTISTREIIPSATTPKTNDTIFAPIERLENSFIVSPFCLEICIKSATPTLNPTKMYPNYIGKEWQIYIKNAHKFA